MPDVTLRTLNTGDPISAPDGTSLVACNVTFDGVDIVSK